MGDENVNRSIEQDARWEAQITDFSSQHGREASRLEGTKEKKYFMPLGSLSAEIPPPRELPIEPSSYLFTILHFDTRSGAKCKSYHVVRAVSLGGLCYPQKCSISCVPRTTLLSHFTDEEKNSNKPRDHSQ